MHHGYDLATYPGGLQNDVAESTRQNCYERSTDSSRVAVSCQPKQLVAYQMQSHGPGAWVVEEAGMLPRLTVRCLSNAASKS